MKRITNLTVVFLLITACGDNEIPRFISENSGEIIKYKIEMSDNVISSYSKYSNDNFIEKTNFTFGDSEIKEITTNSSNSITHKKFYFLGDNLFAASSVDSGFDASGLRVSHIQYTYEGNYLKSKIVSWRQFGDTPDSSSYTMIYEVEEGNTGSIKTIPDNGWGCTDNYRFSSQMNIIDLDNFSNQITGTINKNLIKHISWNPDCHSAPSTTTPYSDFSYELNENGCITKKIETYTPDYHTGSKEVKRTISTTLYEYNAH